MKTMKYLAMGITAALAAGQANAGAIAYKFTDLPGENGANSIAYGINNSGQIVGSADTDKGAPYAVRWENSVAFSLSNGFSRGYAINDAGHTVGFQTEHF